MVHVRRVPERQCYGLEKSVLLAGWRRGALVVWPMLLGLMGVTWLRVVESLPAQDTHRVSALLRFWRTWSGH